MNTVNAKVLSVTLQIEGILNPVTIRKEADGVKISAGEFSIYAGNSLAIGTGPRAKLQAFILTNVCPDKQWDALEVIRTVAKEIAPGSVSDKDTLAIYTEIAVKI